MVEVSLRSFVLVPAAFFLFARSSTFASWSRVEEDGGVCGHWREARADSGVEERRHISSRRKSGRVSRAIMKRQASETRH